MSTRRLKKPPVGLEQKDIFYDRIKKERYKLVCGAISRYWKAGFKIDVEWIEEYNEFIESFRNN